MTRKIIFIGLSFLVLTGLLALGTWKGLHAVGAKYAKETPRLSHYESWAKLLELSEDQKKQISGLELEFKKDLETIEPELAKARIALCRLLMENGASHRDETSVAIEKISGLTSKQETRTAAYLLSLKGLLTADQQRKLFQTLMKDLCSHCRTHLTTTKMKEDLCGMCQL